MIQLNVGQTGNNAITFCHDHTYEMPSSANKCLLQQNLQRQSTINRWPFHIYSLNADLFSVANFSVESSSHGQNHQLNEWWQHNSEVVLCCHQQMTLFHWVWVTMTVFSLHRSWQICCFADDTEKYRHLDVERKRNCPLLWKSSILIARCPDGMGVKLLPSV